ncbi:thymidylate synthase (FAD) [Motilibacter rhizosphaerae]|uniref:FAD-dependent thymidylate synthase n=1 Tax=Motilibacter rhizosphaerae TaxID=598652 RepID=A0A4Q7NA92_9ACTN|nr:FAD-dependent thymidylate synthase [Motilibacter rhizosphaerae]RZS79420.1 thymidylate synthase (FAD) [Motilibacter rhizosphaerae]
MRDTSPQVFLIAKPSIDWAEVGRYLESVGGTAWLDRVRDEEGPDGERLVEFMGRMCYRSWAPGLNPNVTRVREDSTAYLRNILRSAHGSVLEHANYSFVFADVSRVFTHELVRHRAGAAISQESLRYVRLTDLPFEHPGFVREDAELKAAADALLAQMESFQELVVERTGIAGDGVDFHTKKTVTSAARRYAPDGVATTIGWTVNIRAVRHVIAMRTDPGAEEEIRRVFDQVAQVLQRELPALLGDFVRDDDGTWRPEFSKV